MVLLTLVPTPGCKAPVSAAPGSDQGICSLCEGVQHPQQDCSVLLLWHTHRYAANLLNLSQQQQHTDLQEMPMTTHPTALANPQPQEGERWESSLSNVTWPGFLPPAIWRCWLLLPRLPISTPSSHGDSLGPREQTYPLVTPQRANKKSMWLDAYSCTPQPCSIWAGGQLFWDGSALPLSASCTHSPRDGPAHAPLCSAPQGLTGALQMPTLPASISLVRTCSWTSCLGPSFFWGWINKLGMGDGV